MFVKTLKPNIVIDVRTYPLGSVVEVADLRAQVLVKLGHVAIASGPASEPTSPPDGPDGVSGVSGPAIAPGGSQGPSAAPSDPAPPARKGK